MVWGIIGINNNTLKGISSIDLPGKFPFTFSKCHNHIFCMYDYDSNVLWSVSIKSRNSADLISEFEECYKELANTNTNTTPILYRLDKISDDSIKAIKESPRIRVNTFGICIKSLF